MAQNNIPWYPANYNKIIETDPQIVKVPGAVGETFNFGWGSRTSLLKHMSGDPKGQTPSQPSAPEMTIKHIG